MNRYFTKPAVKARGFTLIELLIVIAVLGILAAATLAVLDPIDKIRAGNDSKVMSDIVGIAKAAEAYAVANDGTYPTGTGDLVTSGDLRSVPKPPGGYGANYTWSGGGNNNFTVSGTLKSKKYTSASTPVFKYNSGEGRSCAAATAATACP